MHIQSQEKEGSRPTNLEHLCMRLWYLLWQFRYCSFRLLGVLFCSREYKYCRLFLRLNSFNAMQCSYCLAVQVYRGSHILTILTSCLQLEMKQKSLMGRGNDTEEKQNTEASEVNPETLGKCCFSKCISIPGSLVKHCLVNLSHYFCCKRQIRNYYFLIP